MNLIYNAAISSTSAVLRVYRKLLRKNSRRKFSRFLKGRDNLIARVSQQAARFDRSRPTIWFHAASLGEYGVARPLIRAIKKKGPCNVVVSFFSPAGYEPLEQNHPDIDLLCYLPLDTRRNAKAFVEAIRPDRAVFMISEYWPNILERLKFNGIPTFLVSAIIRDNSQFFHWYGKIYRKSLSAFSHIYVLDNGSRFNLAMLGYTNVTVTGDALFDNAALVARTPWTDEVLEAFSASAPHGIFAAGSISDHNDQRLMARLIERNPQVKFILVPHDVTPDTLSRTEAMAGEATIRYSQCTPRTDFSQIRSIIIDCVGKLAYIYRYARWAYVGGGFTPLLHSVIEATVYGIPVAFGPRVERKVTPQQLCKLGLGRIVTTPEELCEWFDNLRDNPGKLDGIREEAAAYVARNEGATENIVNTITSKLWAND